MGLESCARRSRVTSGQAPGAVRVRLTMHVTMSREMGKRVTRLDSKSLVADPRDPHIPCCR